MARRPTARLPSRVRGVAVTAAVATFAAFAACAEPPLESRRAGLVRAIWGAEGMPKDDRHWVVQRGAQDKDLGDVLRGLDILYFDAGHGVMSKTYHFQSAQPNHRLFVYVYGHHGTFLDSRGVLRKFLERGYDVLAFDMPLKGLNAGLAYFQVPSGRYMKLYDHTPMDHLERRGLDLMPIFFSPITRGLNHVEKTFRYQSIDMTGISGGGWTTHVYAAVDPRIRRSYPVAGSLPHDLRIRKRDRGDYEQFAHRRMYDAAGFIEMMALAAMGHERAQVQILNEYDSCCFAGRDHREDIAQYEALVNRVLRANDAPARFRVWVDSTHTSHKISDAALAFIFDDLELANGGVRDAGPAPLPPISAPIAVAAENQTH